MTPPMFLSRMLLNLLVVTLDLSKYDTEEGKEELARQLLEAVNKKGFFYLKNFGLPAEVVNRQFGIGSEFYSVPLGDRLKSISDLEHGNSNGYAPAGKRDVGQGLTGESFFLYGRGIGRDMLTAEQTVRRSITSPVSAKGLCFLDLRG